MVSYDYEEFVYGKHAGRDPEDLSEVFLSKGKHGGIILIDNRPYEIQNYTSGLHNSRLSIKNEDGFEQIKSEDGMMYINGNYITDNLKIIISCSNCISRNLEINGDEVVCSDCDEILN